MTTEQAKTMDIVAYLQSNNIHPVKVIGHRYWYYSPFRNERTPSFTVNRLFNLWYDFGEGKGGNLIDLGIRLEGCTVKDFLAVLDDNAVLTQIPFSFYRRNNIRQDKQIKILSVHAISSYRLITYLQKENQQGNCG